MHALIVIVVVVFTASALLLGLLSLGFYAVWKAFRDLFWDN